MKYAGFGIDSLCLLGGLTCATGSALEMLLLNKFARVQHVQQDERRTAGSRNRPRRKEIDRIHVEFFWKKIKIEFAQIEFEEKNDVHVRWLASTRGSHMIERRREGKGRSTNCLTRKAVPAQTRGAVDLQLVELCLLPLSRSPRLDIYTRV